MESNFEMDPFSKKYKIHSNQLQKGLHYLSQHKEIPCVNPAKTFEMILEKSNYIFKKYFYFVILCFHWASSEWEVWKYTDKVMEDKEYVIMV